MENNYFTQLEKLECEVEKKNGLNYISWSDGWTELKRKYPDATYEKIKNWDTYLFKSGTGWSVECEVTVNWITHCADLAVTDHRNQEIKYENIKSTDIQNTLQRAFAKAIAMHWIWLYVYRGEDFPEDDDGNKANTATRTQKQTVDTPTGWTKPKTLTSTNEFCPECWEQCKTKHWKTKEGKPYEMGTCDPCDIRFFVNRKPDLSEQPF